MDTELVPHTAADFLSSLKKLKCVLQQQMLPFPFLSFPLLPSLHAWVVSAN
jgi:hypothetical protein